MSKVLPDSVPNSACGRNFAHQASTCAHGHLSEASTLDLSIQSCAESANVFAGSHMMWRLRWD